MFSMTRKKPENLEEQIAEALREAQASGELRGAKSYGKPLDLGDGYDDTPAELRMAFKVLKDAGYAPAEVQMINELATLREQLATLAADSQEAATLRARINDLQLKVAMRMERLARS